MLTSEHAAKAVRYSLLAGEQAEAQSAWAAAIGHYDAALATLISESPHDLGASEADLRQLGGARQRRERGTDAMGVARVHEGDRPLSGRRFQT